MKGAALYGNVDWFITGNGHRLISCDLHEKVDESEQWWVIVGPVRPSVARRNLCVVTVSIELTVSYPFCYWFSCCLIKGCNFFLPALGFLCYICVWTEFAHLCDFGIVSMTRVLICVFVVVLWRRPRREAGDVWCLPPVWNLRAVIWFHFAVSSLVLLPSPVTLSVLTFSACWSILCIKKILQYFSLRDRLFCMAPV